jgi:hypothetical protein
MFGSPGCWPVEGVGAIEGYRMFVIAAIRRLEGKIGKCVCKGGRGLQEGRRETSKERSVCGKSYRGRSIGDQVRTTFIGVSQRNLL